MCLWVFLRLKSGPSQQLQSGATKPQQVGRMVPPARRNHPPSSCVRHPKKMPPGWEVLPNTPTETVDCCSTSVVVTCLWMHNVVTCFVLVCNAHRSYRSSYAVGFSFLSRQVLGRLTARCSCEPLARCKTAMFATATLGAKLPQRCTFLQLHIKPSQRRTQRTTNSAWDMVVALSCHDVKFACAFHNPYLPVVWRYLQAAVVFDMKALKALEKSGRACHMAWGHIIVINLPLWMLMDEPNFEDILRLRISMKPVEVEHDWSYMVTVGIWASWTISTTITILKLWIYQKLTSCIGIARPWCLAGSQDLGMTGILRGVPTVSKSDKQVTAFQLQLLS